MELTTDEQVEVARFLSEIAGKVSGYDSAQAFDNVSSVEQFTDILKKVPDRIVVVACWDELDD